MNRQQIDRLNRYMKVKRFFTTNIAELSGFTALLPFIDDYYELLTAIFESETEAGTDISGYAEDKAAKREKALLQALKVGAAAIAKFSIDGDENSLRQMNYDERTLRKMRDIDLYVRIRRIYAQANPVKTQLTAYNITEANVDELKTVNDAFFDAIGAPAEARMVQGDFNKESARLMEEVRKLVRSKIKPLMRTLKAVNRQLYDYFEISLRIDNTGSRKFQGMEMKTIALEGGESKMAAATPQPGANPKLYIKNMGPGSFILCTAAEQTASCAMGFNFHGSDSFFGYWSQLGMLNLPYIILTNTSRSATEVKFGMKEG